MVNTKNRDELYKEAPSNIQELYSGERTGEILRNIADKAGILDKQAYKTFALSVGDIILDLYQPDSLRVILKDKLNLSDDKLTLIEQELKPLLSSLPKTEAVVQNTVLEPVNQQQITDAIEESKKTSSITKVDTPPAPKPETPIITPVKESPYSQVKPLRTFAQDVELSRAHSYGAFRGNNSQNEEDDEEPVHRSNQDDWIKN